MSATTFISVSEGLPPSCVRLVISSRVRTRLASIASGETLIGYLRIVLRMRNTDVKFEDGCARMAQRPNGIQRKLQEPVGEWRKKKWSRLKLNYFDNTTCATVFANKAGGLAWQGWPFALITVRRHTESVVCAENARGAVNAW